MSVVALISGEAIAQGVPPELALAVARRESGYNQSARGAAGEVGVFQLMPGTAGDLGVNPYDLSENIHGGVSYLRQQFDRFGDWATALAAYNAGPGRAHNPPSSTRGYVADILSDWGGAEMPQPGSNSFWASSDALRAPLTATGGSDITLPLLAVSLGVVALIAWRS